MQTIIPIQSFYGSANAEGTQTRDYLAGHLYDIPDALATIFLANQLVTLCKGEIEHDWSDEELVREEQPEDAPAETAKAGPRRGRKGKAGSRSTVAHPAAFEES